MRHANNIKQTNKNIKAPKATTIYLLCNLKTQINVSLFKVKYMVANYKQIKLIICLCKHNYKIKILQKKQEARSRSKKEKKERKLIN